MRTMRVLLTFIFLTVCLWAPNFVSAQESGNQDSENLSELGAQNSTPSSSALPSPAPFFKRTDVTPPAIRLPSLIRNDSQFARAGENLIMVVIGWVVNLLSLLGGLVAFGFALYGGILYTTAGPNPAQAQQGKSMIIGAVVGILIMSLAYLVVLFIRDAVIGIIG